MKINDVLETIGIKSKKVDCKNYNVKESELELCIEDDLLTVTLGQWMGMVYDSTKTSSRGLTVFTSLEPQEYLDRFGVSAKEKTAINRRFANILTRAGFPGEDICVLENFDADNNTFEATFFHKDEQPKFKIRFGSWLENGPELTVTCNNEVNLYNVWMGDMATEDRVELDYSIKTLDDKGKKLARSISQYSYRTSLYDKENKINVNIEYPMTLDLSLGLNPMVNEELMEEILEQVEFPVDIEELTTKISKALRLVVNYYPSISINVAKMDDKNNTAVTDEVKFKNGKFVSLKLTRNGRTISIDEFDSWSYVTDGYNITQDKDKNISYGFKSMPVDQFEAMPSPTELVSNASTDVEEVRGIAMSLFKK